MARSASLQLWVVMRLRIDRSISHHAPYRWRWVERVIAMDCAGRGVDRRHQAWARKGVGSCVALRERERERALAASLRSGAMERLDGAYLMVRRWLDWLVPSAVVVKRRNVAAAWRRDGMMAKRVAHAHACKREREEVAIEMVLFALGR